MSELVTIKELATPGKFNLGLEKEGRSKFPGCTDIIQPPIARDGRWRTGLDELAIDVLEIRDLALKQETQENIKAARLELESLTGYDLSGKSSFWDTYYVEIDTKKPLDLANPLDRIKYSVIMASNNVAASLKGSKDMEHLNTKYYVSKKHEDVEEEVTKSRRKNKASAKLEELIGTPDELILVGRYLDLPVSNTTPITNMYQIFQTYLDADDKLGSIDKFMRASEASPNELNLKVIFTDATKHNVIRLTQGLYQRGNITLGKTPKEVMDFLGKPTNSGELLSIQEEVDYKKKFG